MTPFDKAFEETVDIEGGFGDDPRDRGNWTGGKVGVGVCKGTKYGISAAAYPHLDIKNLTLEEAKRIYKRDYWDRIRGDQLNPSFADELFDIAVNHGVGTAIRCLQETVEVKIDGVLGPITLAAANAWNPDKVVLGLMALRITRYTYDNSWSIYGKGWSRRAARLLWAQSRAHS